MRDLCRREQTWSDFLRYMQNRHFTPIQNFAFISSQEEITENINLFSHTSYMNCTEIVFGTFI
jgi:hypothetical protein